MPMRQEDFDKLMRRVANITKDLIEPGVEYHVTLIVAEKVGIENDGMGVALALGSTAEPHLALEFCNMGASKFAHMAINSRPNLSQVEALIQQVINAFEQHMAQVQEPEINDEKPVTKH